MKAMVKSNKDFTTEVTQTRFNPLIPSTHQLYNNDTLLHCLGYTSDAAILTIW